MNEHPEPRRRHALRSWRAVFVAATIIFAAAACDQVNDLDPGPDPLPDDGAPEVTITSPSTSTTTDQSSIDVSGRATDADGIDSVTVSNPANEHGAFCTVTENEFFTCNDVPLAEGLNELDIVVRDGDGNERTVRVSVTYDPDGGNGGNGDTTPPTLSDLAPGDDTTTTSEFIDVTGDVTDDNAVASVELANQTTGIIFDCDVSGGGFTCSDVLLSSGANELQITAEDEAGNSASTIITITYDAPSSSGDFRIRLELFDSNFTSSQRAALAEAVERWESIITGDLQDLAHDAGPGESCEQGEPAFQGTIDDLLIFVTTFTLTSDTIGLAGPCLTRTSGPDDGTNFVGYMELNTTYLAELEEDGDLVETLVHEIGHILGFGTNWEFGPFDLLDYRPDEGETCETVDSFTELPVYTGAQGIQVYQDDLGGSGGIPVEADGDLGTRCGHWDEDEFGTELMTGFLDHNRFNPLSEMSIASFEDIGLEVDRSQADSYTMPLTAQDRGERGRNLAAAETLLRPIGTVDVETGERTPLPRR